MTIYLKQSTASQEVPLGFFVDSSDGNTEETGLTIANTDIKLWKAGATTLANKNSGGATHISNGVYYCVLDATDTGTLGSLVIFVHVAGALAVKLECVVLAANIYDSLIAGSDLFDVSVTQWNGTAVASPHTAGYPIVTVKDGTGTGEIDTSSGKVTLAPASFGASTLITTGGDALTFVTPAEVAAEVGDLVLASHTDPGSLSQYIQDISNAQAAFNDLSITDILQGLAVHYGTAASGAAGTITLAASASSSNDFYNDALVWVQAGTGAGQVRHISDYVGSSKVASVVPNWITNPASGSTYYILPAGRVDVTAITDTTQVGRESGTAASGAAATITLASGASSSNDYYNDARIRITGGTGAGQSRRISDYVGSSRVASIEPNWITNPDSTSTYEIVEGGRVNVGAWMDTTPLTLSSQRVNVDVGAISGDSTSADNLEAYTDGTTNIPANVVQISGDTTSADNLESYTDGTTPIPSNMTQISGDATAADNLESYTDGSTRIPANVMAVNSNTSVVAAFATALGTEITGTAVTGTLTSSSFTTNLTATTANAYYRSTIRFTSGTLTGQSRTITSYVVSGGVITVDEAFSTAPSNGDAFIIL